MGNKISLLLLRDFLYLKDRNLSLVVSRIQKWIVCRKNGDRKGVGKNPYDLYPLDLLPAQSDCCRSSFFNFFIFYFSLHSTLDGGIWFQTVEFGSVLECDWKMRFIVPKNHPERKRTSILV